MHSIPSNPPTEALHPDVLAGAYAASLGVEGRTALGRNLHLHVTRLTDSLPTDAPTRLWDVLSLVRHEIDDWLELHPPLLENDE